MGKIIILGCAGAIPDEDHENTHFVFSTPTRAILVDCAEHPIQNLRRARVPFESLTDIILTHFHPDHVSGLPMLLMGMWLMGRKLPIRIHGIAHTLRRAEEMISLYDPEGWPGMYPVIFDPIEEKEMALVLETDEIRIQASPVHHTIPAIGLRLVTAGSKKCIVYSGDSEPCAEIIRLARNADILIHEATGAMIGHSSPLQAAEIANDADAKKLYLIHYRLSRNPEDLFREAQNVFRGPVQLCRDLLRIDV